MREASSGRGRVRVGLHHSSLPRSTVDTRRETRGDGLRIVRFCQKVWPGFHSSQGSVPTREGRSERGKVEVVVVLIDLHPPMGNKLLQLRAEQFLQWQTPLGTLGGKMSTINE